MVLLGMRWCRGSIHKSTHAPDFELQFWYLVRGIVAGGGFSAVGHMQSRSPRFHGVTLLDTLLDALLLTRNGPKMLPEGGPPGHVVHGDRSYDSHVADFVLFGVTAEEIRWSCRA